MSAPTLPELLVSHWTPVWAPSLVAGVCAVGYVSAAGRVRGRWPVARTASFLAGLGCLLVALESGIGAYDDRLLSVHMVQHMLLLMLVPLLLLGGRPMILALRALPPAARPRLAGALVRARPLTNPAVCLALFYAVIVLTHVSGFYGATLRHPALHEFEHALFICTGLLLWWPILDADPVPGRRLGGLGRIVYALAAMPPMAILGAYLNRHATLVYAGYAQPARELGISGLADQASAGAIMWVVGDMAMVVVGLWTFVTALVAEERRQLARDARSDASAKGVARP